MASPLCLLVANSHLEVSVRQGSECLSTKETEWRGHPPPLSPVLLQWWLVNTSMRFLQLTLPPPLHSMRQNLCDWPAIGISPLSTSSSCHRVTQNMWLKKWPSQY